MRPLDGEVAVVAGAGGNLGPHWVRTLADAGARVFAFDRERLDEVDDAAVVHVADVTDRLSLDQAAERCRAELGTATILVNNAGVDAPPGTGGGTLPVDGIPVQEFRRVLEVNLTGTFQTIQAFGPAMVEARRGSIVNIGSLYANLAPDPFFYEHLGLEPPFLKPPAYGASKAGVFSLTRYFARLWGPFGVRVNMLSPGGVSGAQDETFKEKFAARVPLRRLAAPEDLVGALLFLASDASSYVTGVNLLIDGGFSA